MELGILCWIIWGGQGEADTITRILMRKDRKVKVGDMRTATKRREREEEWGEGLRFEDAKLLALKMEGGATSQGMGAASRRWKRKENGFSPGAPRRNGAGLIPEF